MSRLCIVGMANIKHISLISLYTKSLDDNKVPYDIIYLDRYGIEEKTTAQNHYCYNAAPTASKASRLLSFLGFRRFVIRTIKANRYKVIITWQATTAYLLCDFLLRRYKKRFVMNIRDYIMENNPFIHAMLKKLVQNAAYVTISSEGFHEFLPVWEYVRVNSINEELFTNIHIGEKSEKSESYKIGFVGNCRFFKESYKLIDSLANDGRFELWYCGTNSEVLSRYAQEHDVNNVHVMPAFERNETLDIIARFDIINSAFGNDAIDNRTLMPIRLYTALGMHLPILVSEGTQLAKEVRKGGIGFVIQSYDTLADQLYKYLHELDPVEFASSCDAYLSAARDENMLFYNKLEELTCGLR